MTFGSIEFCYDLEEVHSKRERLEIIVLLTSEKLFYLMFPPKSVGNSSNM